MQKQGKEEAVKDDRILLCYDILKTKTRREHADFQSQHLGGNAYPGNINYMK